MRLGAANAANDDQEDEPASAQKQSPTIRYMGTDMPAELHPDTVMLRRLSDPQGCDLAMKETWPIVCPPPVWATNKWLFHKPDTPSKMVQEYLVGYPNPPALRDLEEIYGPDAVHIKKGKSWRSHMDRDEANRKRKAWSERQALHDFINLEPNTATERLEGYIATAFSTELAQLGLSASAPGHAVMRKTWLLMKKNTAGASERSEKRQGNQPKRGKRTERD